METSSAKRLAVQSGADSGPIPVPSAVPGPSPMASGTPVALPHLPPLNGIATGTGGAPQPRSRADEWQRSIEKVVKAVVSVHFSSVTPFDTERTYVSEATGFVVDAERGIIMTNRHVVGPGPFRGYAVFDNHEECPVNAIYRDPVHDFGFLRYDPSAIKHMQVEALNLKPENAKVGSEIRVVGNDAGEKLSILAGFISRVDRNAPEYGDLTYNDFNTEYIQAAASASGGSSGSPVVDIEGNVVALQAGGSSVASTDFFLPLFRGKRALKCIQDSHPITRGTIQVRWLLRPYDECIRLGLTPAAEKQARRDHPESIGLLVADTILPEGPSDGGKIEEGDCLLAVNNKPLALFRDLEAILDSSVGQIVTLTVMRSGELLHHEIKVQDLFAITPDRFVRVAGGVFHNLSYQIASYYAIPVKGLYVAYTGTYFNPTGGDEYTGWILEELDDKPTPDLDVFIEVVRAIPSGKRVPAKFKHVTDSHTIVTSIVDVNHQWIAGPQDFELAVCNNSTGLWDFTQLGPGAPPEAPKRESARFVPLNHREAPPTVAALNNSIVRVRMLRPALLEGFNLPDVQMHGFVVDAEEGFVLVSRLCVPHYLVDLSVVVAESVSLPAKVIFLHPQQGYAIIQYDPALIEAPIRSAPLAAPVKSEADMVGQGTPLTFIGYDAKCSAIVANTRVTDVALAQIPIGFEAAPRFRATNIESIGVDSFIIPELDSGLLVDANTGMVRAIWMCFLGDVNNNTHRDRIYRFGIDASTVSETVRLLRESPIHTSDPRFVDLEVKAIKFASARVRKVPDRWIQEIEEAEGSRLRPELLSVARVSSTLVKNVIEGDIIVAVDGKLATHVTQLYNLPSDKESVKLTVIRRGKEVDLIVPTTATSDTITKSLASWCGVSVHKPHHAVLQQVKNPPSQVYVVSSHTGSPANMYGVFPTHFITHINGEATPDIDTFYRLVKSIPDNTYVKMRIVTFDGVPQALSIRTNYHYFPTWRIDLNTETGEWRPHE